MFYRSRSRNGWSSKGMWPQRTSFAKYTGSQRRDWSGGHTRSKYSRPVWASSQGAWNTRVFKRPIILYNTKRTFPKSFLWRELERLRAFLHLPETWQKRCKWVLLEEVSRARVLYFINLTTILCYALCGFVRWSADSGKDHDSGIPSGNSVSIINADTWR